MTMTARRPDLYRELKGTPIEGVAKAIGLTVASKRIGPCPACHAERSGREDRRPPVGLTDDRRAWQCHRCGEGGDGADLVRLVAGGGKGAAGWAAARELAASAGLVAGDGADTAALERARATREAAAARAALEAATARLAVERRRDVVAGFYSGLGMLAERPDAAAWLRSRAIDPAAVGVLDLARAWPAAEAWRAEDRKAEAPWARFAGLDWWEAGVHLAVALVDERGNVRAMRGRPLGGDRIKEVSPAGAGVIGGLVMADPVGRWLLARGPDARPGDLVDPCPPGLAWRWSGQVIIAEGVPDWLTHAGSDARAVPGKQTAAVLGVFTGAWSGELAARLPLGCSVKIATHDDPAGDKLAAGIAATLAGRSVSRVRGV